MTKAKALQTPKVSRTPVKRSITDKEYLQRLAKRIADQMKAKRAAKRRRLTQKRVMTSFSDPSKKYVVSAQSCTCPDHTFRHRECKHMKMFILDLSDPGWTKDDELWLKKFS